MLELKLRPEFLGKRLAGTAIELSNDSKTGATQIGAQEFLRITYPTHDLLKGLEAVGPGQGRPVVVIGERGLGKSHLLAALHHAVSDPASTRDWLRHWAGVLNEPRLSEVPLRDQMSVLGESLHRQRYKFLWDLIFDRHPHGTYIRGKWEGRGEAKTDIPSDELMVELFTHQPTMLLLDEFQTWYDGLTNSKQYPMKSWAFNFIQILSEIAKERPDLLVLVVSVRNGQSDAYQQIHRVNPIAIDFKSGGDAERIQRDRRRMLLHRLFENRSQVSSDRVEALIGVHVREYYRLTGVPTLEQERRTAEFLEAWPFAPHLLRLLEEQVLVATEAQDTRDLIKILASLYRTRGDKSCILTASDFRIDDEKSGISTLLDSVANPHHRALREKANLNLISVRDAVPNSRSELPHLTEVISALWLRSIAEGNLAGAEPAVLQADLTRDRPLDNNQFAAEIGQIEANSFNLHRLGGRLVFRGEENPRAKVLAAARNDKLFADGSDLRELAREVRYVLGGGDDVARIYRVIPLSKNWIPEPWSFVEEQDRPERWDGRIPVLVLPEGPDPLDQQLGRWLKEQLQTDRNTVRFLLPKAATGNIFTDSDLLLLTRARMKAKEWSAQGPEYKKLETKFQSDLKDQLKRRFDRFAILTAWNNADPGRSQFAVERVGEHGDKTLEAVEKAIRNNLFAPEDFSQFVLEVAGQGKSLADLLAELRNPRPSGLDCIPWLGETAMKERVADLCAQGVIAVNLRGQEYLQAETGESEENAKRRFRSKFSVSGRELKEVRLMLPSAIPATGGSHQDEGLPSVPSGRNSAGPGSSSYVAEESPPPPIFGSSLFETDTPEGHQPARVRLTNPPTSALTLVGKLESWGIGPATDVHELRFGAESSSKSQVEKFVSCLPEDVVITVSVRKSAATGAQVKALLRNLPDGMTFDLSLEKADG